MDLVDDRVDERQSNQSEKKKCIAVGSAVRADSCEMARPSYGSTIVCVQLDCNACAYICD